MVRIGSVLALYGLELDSCENRSGSDRPDLDSGWIRYGLVLARHGFVREPIWVGAVRSGFGLDLLWVCIEPTSIRVRTDMDRVGPTWVRIGSVLALNGPELDSCENRSGSDRPVMDSDWIRDGLVWTRHGFVREPIWIGSVRHGFGLDLICIRHGRDRGVGAPHFGHGFQPQI